MTEVPRRTLLVARALLLSSTPRPHLITITTLATTTTSLPGLEAQHRMLAKPTRPFPHTGWGCRHRGARQAHSLLLNNNS